MATRKKKKKKGRSRAPSVLASEFTLERCAEALRADPVACNDLYEGVQRLLRGENWSHHKARTMKKLTVDTWGRPNGYVIPIWNVNTEPEERPDQVYLTVCSPHSRKGPHLHMKRRGRFCCIRGNVRVVTRVDGVYDSVTIGEDHATRSLIVPVGVPAAIYNDSPWDAFVINMPSPAWSPEEPDEHPVENWID